MAGNADAALESGGAFVAVAEFEVKPDKMEALLAVALADDARHSAADEPGCRQFDVIRPDRSDTAAMFYEVYDSRGAFDRHFETPHRDRVEPHGGEGRAAARPWCPPRGSAGRRGGGYGRGDLHAEFRPRLRRCAES